MPRPRKPTEVLRLSGAFQKDPKRTRAIGPKATRPLGFPPKYFSESETEVWVEIESNVAAGVLTSAERYVVELLARLISRLREGWLTGAEMSQMTWCLSHLGMTAVDRSKVMGLDPEIAVSPFDEFMQ